MHFSINGTDHNFTPIRLFRQEQALPPTFGVNLFEPKDYSDLGSIEAAGAELNTVRAAVLDAIGSPHTLSKWLTAAPLLAGLFRHNLILINDVVRLKEVEIDFAVAGFGDVLQAVIYELIRARAARQPPPPFGAIYGAWLNSTLKISQTVHIYPYNDDLHWEIQVLTHVYGRFGLLIQAVDKTHYVYDAALGCPAEGYMATLLADVALVIYRSAYT